MGSHRLVISLPDQLKANPDWASLPLFDRTAWKRVAFGAFAESIGERAEPKDAQEEIYVGLEHLDPQCLHIRRWGKGSDVTGTKLRFRKGDIIFGRRRAYQRMLAVAEFDGICRTQRAKARRGKILFINAVNEVTRERAQSFLTDEHLQRVVRAYQDFKDEPGFVCVATVEQVRANGGNLGLPLYLEPVSLVGESANKSEGGLTGALSEWLESSSQVHKALQALGGAKTA